MKRLGLQWLWRWSATLQCRRRMLRSDSIRPTTTRRQRGLITLSGASPPTLSSANISIIALAGSIRSQTNCLTKTTRKPIRSCACSRAAWGSAARSFATHPSPRKKRKSSGVLKPRRIYAVIEPGNVVEATRDTRQPPSRHRLTRRRVYPLAAESSKLCWKTALVLSRTSTRRAPEP